MTTRRRWASRTLSHAGVLCSACHRTVNYVSATITCKVIFRLCAIDVGQDRHVKALPVLPQLLAQRPGLGSGLV